MFDAVTKHKRIAQIILGLITLPFAFWGVDSYFRGGSGPQPVATVGREKVTQEDYEAKLREQQDRMRQALGRNYDPALFDNPEVRYAIVDQLVSQRLLEQRARSEKFRVTDGQVIAFRDSIPAFQVDGRYSPDRARDILQQQDPPKSLGQFEQLIRMELMLMPLQDPVVMGSVAAKTSVERYLALLDQVREVSVAQIDPASLVKGVKVDDAEVKAFYEANPAAFQTPEQAKIEYVMLSQDALTAQTKLEADEAKKQYDATSARYSTNEERQASHILIAVKPDASEADKAAAKKKAEALLAQAKAAPNKFAELAKANSQDPGSAGQGGDLGTFARGAMLKPFDDAVFAAKLGDIVGPVQTEAGFHVIKVIGITSPRVQTFEEVRPQIEAELKRQRAAQQFANEAADFQNLVYEQADSLEPTAKKLNLKLESTPPVTRSQVQAFALGNPKFVEALFSPESIQSKRNTEAIEVAPGVLMSGRIVDYMPAKPRPLAEVQEQIREQLTRRAGSALAEKSGREKIALLEQGKSDKEAGITFGKTVPITRNLNIPGFSPDTLKSIFQAAPAKLPAYVGAPNERGGYTVYRVSRVIDPPAPDAGKLAAAQSRVSGEIGRELMNAYIASLKAGAEVKVNEASLEKR
jgi:peptidyl-prolyl cis-trans isomerase D